MKIGAKGEGEMNLEIRIDMLYVFSFSFSFFFFFACYGSCSYSIATLFHFHPSDLRFYTIFPIKMIILSSILNFSKS